MQARAFRGLGEPVARESQAVPGRPGRDPLSESIHAGRPAVEGDRPWKATGQAEVNQPHFWACHPAPPHSRALTFHACPKYEMPSATLEIQRVRCGDSGASPDGGRGQQECQPVAKGCSPVSRPAANDGGREWRVAGTAPRRAVMPPSSGQCWLDCGNRRPRQWHLLAYRCRQRRGQGDASREREVDRSQLRLPTLGP